MKRLKKRELFGAIVPLSAIVGLLLLLATNTRAGNDAPLSADISPMGLVSNLDLSCHRSRGGRPPVDVLQITHLNPVLQEMGLHEQEIFLHRLEQLCVPVAKNDVMPPEQYMEIVRWVDLACFAATSESHEIELQLSQLNPVLVEMGIPDQDILMGQLRQLCVPVVKNDVFPPEEVLELVRYIDVACYDIETPAPHPFPLHLTHLNPVLIDEGLKEQPVEVHIPKQLCVPVMKEHEIPPDHILELVKWIDFLKYSEYSKIPLRLRHINPLFQDVEPFDIELFEIQDLAVPVAKNGMLPPQ